MKLWEILTDVAVSEADLRRAMDAINAGLSEKPAGEAAGRTDRRGFNARADVVAELFSAEPNKALAVNFRIQALSQLADRPEMRAWTLPRDEAEGAGTPARAVIFAAAAIHPLADIDGEIGFEAADFFARVLSLATDAGEA